MAGGLIIYRAPYHERRMGRGLPWGGVRPALMAAWIVLLGMGWSPSLEAQISTTEPDLESVPVVLVPGWGDNAPDLQPLVLRLMEAGWPQSRISALTFQDAVGSNRDHAAEVSQAVETLRSLTGADRVDVVAHSMGGLAVRYYLQFKDGHEAVRRVVFLGTPHRGTVAAMLAWGDGGREMVPGSDFLSRLNDEGGIPAGVETLAIRTPVDLRVIPGSSAMLPGARNLEICCPTHPGLVDDEDTARAVVQFLRAELDQLIAPDDSIPLRTPRGERPRR
jgi:triacylglycerol lipase